MRITRMTTRDAHPDLHPTGTKSQNTSWSAKDYELRLDEETGIVHVRRLVDGRPQGKAFWIPVEAVVRAEYEPQDGKGQSAKAVAS